jgi:RNA polymerase sigma factor (sigma-70 family)
MATARQAGMRSSDAADVCQVVWLRLFQHLDRLRQPERVGAWLRTTARREAIQVLVRSSREVSCEQERFDVVQLDARDVDAGLLDGERDVALRDALQALPPRTQRVLCLLAAEGSSYAAAAAELEVPIGSLGPTRARGLESLRRALPVSAPVSAIAS